MWNWLRRRWAWVCVLIVLSFATSVAVALACWRTASWLNSQNPGVAYERAWVSTLGPPVRRWHWIQWRVPGTTFMRVFEEVWSSESPYETDFEQPAGVAADALAVLGDRQDTEMCIDDVRYGWPFRCVRSMELRLVYLGVTIEVIEGISASEAGFDSGVVLPLIPTKILWWGMAGNAIFYLGIYVMVYAAARTGRMRLRARRQFCVVCAYPRGAAATCPECGTVAA